MENFNYHFDPFIGVGKFDIIRISCSVIYCLKQLDQIWDPTIDNTLIKKRYIRVYNCNYFSILGKYNYCITVNILDNVIDKDYFEK